MARQKQGSSGARVRAYRARLRSQGLRPVQLWLPDVRSAEFADAAHRQAQAVATSSYALNDQAFIDAITTEP